MTQAICLHGHWRALLVSHASIYSYQEVRWYADFREIVQMIASQIQLFRLIDTLHSHTRRPYLQN